MLEGILNIIVVVIFIYLLLGLLFAIAFLWKGVVKVDNGAEDTSIFFKLLILPGCVLFWVYLLSKWMKS
jgi:hypothetical protein